MCQTILEEMDTIEKGEAYRMPKLPNNYSGVMSPEEFMVNMRKIHYEYKDDLEERHIQMDTLMCELLIDLGYWEGINIFNNTEMWWA